MGGLTGTRFGAVKIRAGVDVGRAGNLSPARWASPTNPKLGPGWSFILLARKNRAKFGPARLTHGLNKIGSG